MGKQLEWMEVPTWAATAEDGPFEIVIMITRSAGAGCVISETHFAGREQAKHEQRVADDLEEAKRIGQEMFEAWGADRPAAFKELHPDPILRAGFAAARAKPAPAITVRRLDDAIPLALANAGPKRLCSRYCNAMLMVSGQQGPRCPYCDHIEGIMRVADRELVAIDRLVGTMPAQPVSARGNA